MAMALEPADHELIATICNAAARVPVIEAGETSMLAQLQRALLAEGLDDLSLAAVANRAVDDWTRTVHQRDSEDRAEWLRLYSAARGHQDRRSGHASEEGLP
jgi:hypothetical protein